MAQEKRYVPPRLRRRERLAKTVEGIGPPITEGRNSFE